jgi:hypothetical protein
MIKRVEYVLDDRFNWGDIPSHAEIHVRVSKRYVKDGTLYVVLALVSATWEGEEEVEPGLRPGGGDVEPGLR